MALVILSVTNRGLGKSLGDWCFVHLSGVEPGQTILETVIPTSFICRWEGLLEGVSRFSAPIEAARVNDWRGCIQFLSE